MFSTRSMMVVGLLTVGTGPARASHPDPAAADVARASSASELLLAVRAAVDGEGVPSCGDRMTLPVPWRTEIAFGSSVPRAHWLAETEDIPGFRGVQEPPPGSLFFWRGVGPSEKALTCGESPDTCAPGGSRIALVDGAGAPFVVHVHFRPEQLPALPADTPVRLDLNLASGQLTLTTEDGRPVLGIVRYEGIPNGDPRSWRFGPIDVAAGAAICSAVNEMCRYRDVAQSIVVKAAGESLTLAPTEEVQVTVDGTRYQVVHHVAVVRGISSPDGIACAAARAGLDALSVLRLP